MVGIGNVGYKKPMGPHPALPRFEICNNIVCFYGMPLHFFSFGTSTISITISLILKELISNILTIIYLTSSNKLFGDNFLH